MSQRKGDLVDASLRVSEHADRSTRLAPEAAPRAGPHRWSLVREHFTFCIIAKRRVP